MPRRLWLKGFKAFEDGDVPLRPFTVLIGPNGAGKTTIMEAIDVLGRLVTGSIKDLLEVKGWEYGDLPHLRAASSEFSIATEHVLGEQRLTWSVALGARRRPGISSERVVMSVPVPGDPAVRLLRELLEHRGRRMSRVDLKGEAESITQTLTSSWLSAISSEDAARFPLLLRLATWARGIRGYFFLDPIRLRSPSRGQGNKRSTSRRITSRRGRRHRPSRSRACSAPTRSCSRATSTRLTAPPGRWGGGGACARSATASRPASRTRAGPIPTPCAS